MKPYVESFFKYLIIIISIIVLMSTVFSVTYFKAIKKPISSKISYVDLPVKEKLVTVEYRDGKLWCLTRPALSNEIPIQYKLSEPNPGLFDVDYIIRER